MNQVQKTYTSRNTYLLSKPFPVEKIILGSTKESVLRFLYKGGNPTSISNSLEIARSTTTQHLQELREKGLTKKGINDEGKYGDLWHVTEKGKFLIEKCVGFPTFSTHKGVLSKRRKCRGHAFIWKIKPNKQFNWKNILEKNKIPSELKGLAKTPRIIVGGKKVWLGKTYITIFEPDSSSFFNKNPIKARNNAIYEMYLDVKRLKRKLGISFDFKFTCRRQHYGFIDSPDAKYFIKRRKKILIKNEKGYWFTIDLSENKYREGETIHTEDAVDDGIGYQNYMNSHKRTGFKVTPGFILESLNKQGNIMNGIQENQQIFAQNMKTHIEAIKTLSQAVKDLKVEVKKINGSKL